MLDSLRAAFGGLAAGFAPPPACPLDRSGGDAAPSSSAAAAPSSPSTSTSTSSSSSSSSSSVGLDAAAAAHVASSSDAADSGQGRHHGPRSIDAASVAPAADTSTTATTSSSNSSKQEYLEQKYGSAASHVHLSRHEVDAMLDAVLQDSPTVTYLLQALKQGGCGVGRPFFHVTRCADSVGGGFSTDYGVILCHNRLSTFTEVELAVAHELVHAYDFCRAENLDLKNCSHHACTEIRAASLSGDCALSQEFVRGNLSEALVGQYKRCVRRRALLSVSLNPYCQGGKAEAAVSEMMGRCFKDTDPFPRVPGL